VREEALQLTLSDGRKLLIGGEVPDYGDEYADPWVYNDIIVTHAGGTIEIVTYPKEAFPHASRPVGAVMGEAVYIFGIIDRKRHPGRSRGPVVLRFDTSSYAIAELSVAAPPVRLNLYKGCDTRDGNRVVFPNMRDRQADPELGIAFDLETLTWGEPFPHPHPVGD